jgi:hypothetical protein
VLGNPGARRVRLANVPFVHAKPTFGDVIVVVPVEGGLAWDRGGVEDVQERIHQDGGFYAMIIDYALRSDASDTQAAFDALVQAAEGVVVEGCYGPSESEPGRVYLAVPHATEPEEVLCTLRSANLPLELELVHPRDDGDDDGDEPESEVRRPVIYS